MDSPRIYTAPSVPVHTYQGTHVKPHGTGYFLALFSHSACERVPNSLSTHATGMQGGLIHFMGLVAHYYIDLRLDFFNLANFSLLSLTCTLGFCSCIQPDKHYCSGVGIMVPVMLLSPTVSKLYERYKMLTFGGLVSVGIKRSRTTLN